MYIVKDFICPHCGEEADVWEEEACPVSNSVDAFAIVGCQEDKEGNFIKALDVEIDYGPREVHEPDFPEPSWFCSRCLERIDPEIETEADLFNWLYERGMVVEEEL